MSPLSCESRTATLDDEDDGLDEAVDGNQDELDGDDGCAPPGMLVPAAEIEGIADAAYEEARLDPDQPNVVRLARTLLGPDAVRRGPRPLSSPAVLLRVGEDWRIVLSRSLPRLAALFAIGHELGHWLLRRHGCWCGESEEREADYLGAALLAPHRAFRRAYYQLGADLPALAAAFSTPEAGAALRLGEVMHVPLAVVAPQTVRVRGPENWVWPDESTLRSWARQRTPRPGVRAVRLSDAPRTVVLDASGVA